MIICENIDWNAEEPREKRTHCRRGHPFNKSNTAPRKVKINGLVYDARRCRRCKALADARYRSRRAKAQIAGAQV